MDYRTVRRTDYRQVCRKLSQFVLLLQTGSAIAVPVAIAAGTKIPATTAVRQSMR